MCQQPGIPSRNWNRNSVMTISQSDNYSESAARPQSQAPEEIDEELRAPRQFKPLALDRLMLKMVVVET